VICSERNLFARVLLIELQKLGCIFEPNCDNIRLKIEVMKKTALILVFCLSTVAPLLADGTNVLADEKSRISYAVGMMTGHQWKQQDIDLDPDIYARAIKDAMAGGAMLLTPEQAQQTIDAFKKELAAKQQQRQIEQAAKNKTDGEAFLGANKNQPGVQTLPDGLEYLVITNGTGAIPAAGDTVTVNYRGTLIDGTEFDSSYKRGQPATFPVGGVIPGWTEALQKMNVGSKWKLFIPSELAYGGQGNRGIAPNSVLIFEVELLAVQRPNPQPASVPPPSANPPLTSDIIKVPSAEEMKKGAKIEIIKPENVQKLQQSQSPPAQ
jgi:FKBP-type peptidyl-prolyl cis-trans isomerase FklB